LLLKPSVLFGKPLTPLLQLGVGGDVALQLQPNRLQLLAMVGVDLCEELADALPLGAQLLKLQPVVLLEDLQLTVAVAL